MRIDFAFLWLSGNHRTRAQKREFLAQFTDWPHIDRYQAARVLCGNYSRVSESAIDLSRTPDFLRTENTY